MAILIFLIVLTILVLIHELGHFLMARRFGIKVEEFGFGLPPRAFGIKRGETIYSINWLPIGGFVKLYGEDEAGGGKLVVRGQKLAVADKARAFYAKSVGQRASVVAAGAVMNVLLAVVIFYVFLFVSNFKTDFLLLTDHQFSFVHQENKNLNDTDTVISLVAQDSPAEKAGIIAPSEILAINGQKLNNRKFFIDTINENKGKEVLISWKDIKSGNVMAAAVVPRVSPPKNEGSLGVGFFPVALLSYDTPTKKAFSGLSHVMNITSYTFTIFKRLITVSLEQKTAAPVGEGVAGPVGVYSLFDRILKIPALKEKILGVLNLAGSVSISLAFFNILPIPAVDGGRLFFILVEGIMGRKVNPRIESRIHSAGIAVLLALIALITFRDISRLFAG